MTSVFSSAFYGCKELKNVVILGRIDFIDGYTFYECSSLESVSFPNSVKFIYDFAFYGCDALKEIYFDGTEMQLAVIGVEDGNFRPNSTANRGQAATILVRVAASLGSDE